MSDAEFPNRPTHDDFWKLAEVVIDLDTEMDETPAADTGIKFAEMVGRYADFASVVYMAQQRTSRLGGGAAEVAAWLDGFTAGAAFAAKQKGTE